MFPKFDVVTIGAATRDIFISSPLFKIVRDPKHLERLGFQTGEAQCFALGAKIEVEKPFETMGGGAANAGITFARQGFRVGTFSRVGNDQNGESVFGDLRQDGITPFLKQDSSHGTSFSVILVSPNGERTILDYRGASQHVMGTDIPLAKMSARWVYISPGHIDPKVMEKVIAHYEKQGARIAMNPSKFYITLGTRRLARILCGLDVIIMNREEAAYLTGARYEEEKKIFRRFDDLVKGIAVMTDGPKGVAVSDGKRVYRAGVFKEKKIVDRTGAGDAFGSGFVAALMRRTRDRRQAAKRSVFSEERIAEAIRLGSANATSVVEAMGATPGILTKKNFSAERWRRLPVKEHVIST